MGLAQDPEGYTKEQSWISTVELTPPEPQSLIIEPKGRHIYGYLKIKADQGMQEKNKQDA